MASTAEIPEVEIPEIIESPKELPTRSSVQFGSVSIENFAPPAEGTEEYNKLIQEALAASEAKEDFQFESTEEETKVASSKCFDFCCAKTTVEEEENQEEALPEDLDDLFDIDESIIERASTKVLNAEVEKRLSRLASRKSQILREASIKIEEGTVSFAAFCRQHTHFRNLTDTPAPMTQFLPASPFMSKDHKLDVTCKAFKLDFVTAGNNIVPPFFYAEEEKSKYEDIMALGMDEPTEIDLFGAEAIQGAISPQPVH